MITNDSKTETNNKLQIQKLKSLSKKLFTLYVYNQIYKSKPRL